MEASKEGRNLADFRYTCVGYSLYPDQKEQASHGQQNQTELPICFGLEVSSLSNDFHLHAFKTTARL